MIGQFQRRVSDIHKNASVFCRVFCCLHYRNSFCGTRFTHELLNSIRHSFSYSSIDIKQNSTCLTDPASAPTFSFPFVLDCHQFYELMVAQGEGRSPMTSSDAETDFKAIIIFYIIIEIGGGTTSLAQFDDNVNMK